MLLYLSKTLSVFQRCGSSQLPLISSKLNTYTKEDDDETDTPQKLKLLGKKVLGISGVCFDWGRVCSLRITLFGLGF